MPNEASARSIRARSIIEALDLEAADAIAIGAFTAAALLIGAVVIAMTVDDPGDGPMHTIIACQWARHPRLSTYGGWLPGFTYLAGLCLMLVPDPLLVPRLYNLALSTMTVAPFYLMVRKLYGSPEALLATVALVAMPLRIGLSASALTEPSFLFFVIAGLLCLTIAVERDSLRVTPLVIAVWLFILAEMTRYEMWPLIPLILGYFYFRTRSIAWSVLVAAALAIFPMTWSFENYVHFGNFIHGISAVIRPAQGRESLGAVRTLGWLVFFVRIHLGWLIVVAAIAGLASELYKVIRGRSGGDRAAYVLLVAIVWAMIIKMVLALAGGMVARNLLLGFALLLPFAALAYTESLGRSRRSVAIGAALLVGSMATAYCLNLPRTFVMRKKPHEVIALARWLRTSAYRNDPILITKMDWASTYLPLYAPEIIGREAIVSAFVPEASTDSFIKTRRPVLLITQSGDIDEQARIVRIIGQPLEPMMQKPVYTSGPIEVYDISKLTAGLPQ